MIPKANVKTSMHRIVNIFLENPIINSFIVFMFCACTALYISSICVKFITGDDDITDLMKLILVTINIGGFMLISFGRHINLYKVFRLKVILITLYVILLAGLAFNYHVLIMRFKDPNFGKQDMADPPMTANGGAGGAADPGMDPTPDTMVANVNNAPLLSFNLDYITLALTLVSDCMYLMVYIFFRSRRILMVTSAIIALEVIVFGVSFSLGTDDVIDTVNLSTSLVTLIFAIVFWTGETVVELGRNRFRHFYEDVDMQPLNLGGDDPKNRSTTQVEEA